jgi:type II secretory pathway pseudopilin PulG
VLLFSKAFAMYILKYVPPRYTRYYSCSGFSLLELALILIIISILLVKLIQPLSVSLTQRQYDKTKEVLEEIKVALLGYAQIHGYLPCSDRTGTGLSTSACSNAENNSEGDIPWAELGVDGKDAWGRMIRYRPYNKYTTDPIGFHNDSGLIIRYALDMNNDGSADQKTTTTSRIAALLFSRGPNGTADLCNNRISPLTCPNSSGRIYYTQDAPIQRRDNAFYFDDILTWLPRPVLFHHLTQVEQWKP